MTRLKIDTISIIELFDAVGSSLAQPSSRSIPLLQNVQENDRSPT